MEELQSYSPEEIILANLEELTARMLRSNEQEQAHLRELAREIASEFADNLSFAASLSEHRFPTPQIPLSHEHQPLIRELTLMRRVRLCKELKQLVPTPRSLWQDLFFPAGEELNSFSANRISYQRNRYTDAAFQRFTLLLHEPRAAYAHSFPSVCEDVYNGKSEFCILPLENSSEGRLAGFTSLIEQFDIKIVATCDIRSGEDKLTRFALLRKSMTAFPEGEKYRRLFELSCDCKDDTEAEELLTAARLCGLQIHRADLSPIDQGTYRTRLHGAFFTENGDPLSYLFYLSMEAPQFTPIGLYPHIPV